MDPGVLALAIPLVAIVCATVVKVAQYWSRSRSESQLPREVANRLEALEQEVGTLRRELSEAHERLDFTERLLAQSKEPPRVSRQ
jgi:5-bromo-4-chloroindolyl phosphate hydrolysis protein